MTKDYGVMPACILRPDLHAVAHTGWSALRINLWVADEPRKIGRREGLADGFDEAVAPRKIAAHAPTRRAEHRAWRATRVVGLRGECGTIGRGLQRSGSAAWI